MSLQKTLIVLLLLLLAACQRPGTPAELPDDGPPIAVSQAAAENLGRKLATAASGAQQSGTLSITITQEEITSLLVLGREVIEAQAQEQIPTDLDLTLPLSDPQIYFRGDGTIVVRGGIEFQGRGQPLRIVFAPRASAGELELDFVEGRIGPLPVPEAIFDQLGGIIARLILAGQDVAEISTLQVSEGTFTLVGSVRR